MTNPYNATEEWNSLLTSLRELDIISGVDWDVTADNRYVTNVYVYNDVSFKPFHYETYNLEHMLDRLEAYYIRAQRKERDQKFFDLVAKTWNFIHVTFHLLTWFISVSGAIFIYATLKKAGIWDQIMASMF